MSDNLYIGFLFLFCILKVYAPTYDLLDIEFTTVVKAQSRDCFYQYAIPTQIVRLEFRVIDGGFSTLDISRDLKISLHVRSPKRKTVVEEINKAQAIRKYEVLEAGDYEFCLDNSASYFASKTVYFEVSIDVNSESYRWINEIHGKGRKSNDTISRLERTANKVQIELERVKHYQDTLRVVEARDVHLQEKNFNKVNTLSSLATVIMMLFGALHLFVMKSMFNPSSLLFKMFRKLC